MLLLFGLSLGAPARIQTGWIQGFHCGSNTTCEGYAKWIVAHKSEFQRIYAYCGARVENNADNSSAIIGVDPTLWPQCAPILQDLQAGGVAFLHAVVAMTPLAYSNPDPFYAQSVAYAKKFGFQGYHIDEGMWAKYVDFHKRLAFMSGWATALHAAGMVLSLSEETMLYFHIPQAELYAATSASPVDRWVLLDTYTDDDGRWHSWMNWYGKAIPAAKLGIGFERGPPPYPDAALHMRYCTLHNSSIPEAAWFMLPLGDADLASIAPYAPKWLAGDIRCSPIAAPAVIPPPKERGVPAARDAFYRMYSAAIGVVDSARPRL